MSTEKDSKLLLGYGFTTKEIIEKMKAMDEWDEAYFTENDGCDGIMCEDFVNCYSMESFDEDGIHYVGFEIGGNTLADQLLYITSMSNGIKADLLCNEDPTIIACIHSY